MLTACGGSSNDELNALEVTQILEEANIPCEDQEIEDGSGYFFGDTEMRELGLSDAPDRTELSCSVTGGGYSVTI